MRCGKQILFRQKCDINMNVKNGNNDDQSCIVQKLGVPT